jgi:hypothetical protein
MAHSILFDFDVESFSDVRDHLDALWYEFNELVTALNSRQVCGDPPNTCGAQQTSRRAPKAKSAKRPAKKAKQKSR